MSSKSPSKLINLGVKSDVIPLEKGLYDITGSPMVYSKKRGKKKKVSGEYASWMDRGLGPKGIKLKDVPGWNKVKSFKEWNAQVAGKSLNESLNDKIVYHTTSISRVESIMKNGLIVNSNPNYSTGSLAYMSEIYGMVPIFVSTIKAPYADDEGVVILEINASGLELVADVPSLVDHGAHIDPDGIWFSGRNIIDPISDPDLITFDELFDPYSEYCERAIEITGTAAILENISPERITIL